jgi:hypothetical protein
MMFKKFRLLNPTMQQKAPAQPQTFPIEFDKTARFYQGSLFAPLAPTERLPRVPDFACRLRHRYWTSRSPSVLEEHKPQANDLIIIAVVDLP